MMKGPIAGIHIGMAAVLSITLAMFAWLLGPMFFAEKQSALPHNPASADRPTAAKATQPPPTPASPDRTRTAASSGAPSMTPEPLSARELAEENRKLREANALLQERLRAVLNWILANFRGRFPIPETLFSRVQISPLTDDDQLNPEIAELLRLSPDETERLNDAFAYALDYISHIEAAILTATEPRAGKIILHIPTFKENGQLLKEDLYAALETTLGSDRFARFRKVAENGMLRRFYHFGEASRTMVFELAYEENDPQPRILIKDGYILELAPGVREITATETVATNIPQKYAAYLAWLPEYFTTPPRAQ
jgi:hypothetical protein